MTTQFPAGWESLLNQILECLSDPAMISDAQGKIACVNGAMLKLTGLSREQAVGQSFPYPWLLPQGPLNKLPGVNAGRGFTGVAQVESLVTDAQGTAHNISFSVSPLLEPSGQQKWLLSIGRGVAPAVSLGAHKPGSQALLAQAVEEMPEWVQLSSLDGTIEMVNAAACAISGYARSEIVGQAWPYPWFQDGWRDGKHNAFEELSLTGDALEFEAVCVSRDGESKSLGVTLSVIPGISGEPGRALMVAHDMTERMELNERFLQTEKIRAVSQLASGVAHDINNDLAVILGYSEYLIDKWQGMDEGDQHALDAIQQQAQECAETVRRIQLFSRRSPRSKFTYFSINDVVRDVVESMEHNWSGDSSKTMSGIQLEADLQWVPPVHAHIANLKEGISSLVENAVAALPEGGKVSLRTYCVGDEVVIEVTDDGHGIDPADLRRIFEPFFTTRGPASSGLGLSIAYNLVNQMDGVLTVESKLGVGTTFTVRFPAQSAELLTRSRTEDKTPSIGNLDVLVVDDEPLVAGMLRTFLESAGHHATVFLEGQGAVEAFREREYDLVIVDLGMPEMDGWEVSRHINGINSQVPIIMATGWNMTVDDGEEQGAVIDSVLRKPFAMVELAGAIEMAIKNRREIQT